MHPVHKIKKDIEYNKNLAIDQLQKSGALLNDSSFLNGKLAPAMNKISSSLFYLLTSICSFLMIVILLQNLKSQKNFKQIFFKSSFLSLFSFWLLLLLGTSIKFFFAEKTNAMIIADTCIARSGPKESFTELFKLPAGTKVELLDSEIQKQDSWRKIRFSLGNEGWVMEKDLLKL
jgi:hypothetical protein